MNANKLTEIQNTVVDSLANKGFTVDMLDTSCDEATVFMSKRVKRHSTHYAEVDSHGLVNGLSLEVFLK